MRTSSTASARNATGYAGLVLLIDEPPIRGLASSNHQVSIKTGQVHNAAALSGAVETDPRSLTLGVDVWTSGRLRAYLAETTGTRIAPGWLRVLLHREGFANGRPKHSVAHLQDPVEVAACAERLREVGEKGGR